MNCQETKQWLLSAEANTALPPMVRRHLDVCAKCRRRRARLQRLDEQVRHLPLPAADPGLRAQLWHRIAADADARQPSAQSTLRRWLLPTAAAACVLFALGWLIGRLGAPPATSLPDLAGVPDKEAAERVRREVRR